MTRKIITSAEFVRHFGRYHDEAMRSPITLTKHGRASVVVVSADVFERMINNDDPRRAYGAGEMPAGLAEMFSAQLEQDSADYQATKDD